MTRAALFLRLVPFPLFLALACSGSGGPDPDGGSGDAGPSDGRVDRDATTDAGPDGSRDSGPTGGDAGPGDGGQSADASDACLALGCVEPAACVEDEGTARCECPTGYTLASDERSCDDVDECDTGAAMCGDGSTCRNTPGSFACDCEVGHYWDGDACVRQNVKTLTAGGFHVCEVRPDGSLHCWGHNQGMRAGSPEPPHRLAEPTRVGADDDWRSVSANQLLGGCGLRADASLWCWGQYPGSASASAPTLVDDAEAWAMVDGGQRHACAITTGDELYCWGSNALSPLPDPPLGLLGDPDLPEDVDAPAPIRNDASWLLVSASERHTCALQPTGDLYCWGVNGDGVIGDGTTTDRDVPTHISGGAPWTTVSAGTSGTCGIRTDGTLWCWGSNRRGGVAVDPSVDAGLITAPVQIGSRSDWRTVSMGQNYGCATRTDGSLHCWGELINGRPALIGPTRIGSANDWEEVTVWDVRSGVGGFACGRRSGLVYCWGYDLHGTLGRGTFGSKTAPVRVGSDAWRSVSTAGGRTLAVRDDGTLWIWGVRTYLDLSRTVQEPAQVGSDSDWLEVHGSGTHQCALKDAGTLYCWGANEGGQVGIGSDAPHVDAPSPVGTDTDWTLVRTGAFATCGIRNGGELYCWGATAHADGSAAESDVPVRVGDESDWTDISLRPDFAYKCGIRAGTPFCWGSRVREEVPTPVSDETDWTAIDDGHLTDGACGVRNGGELWCWNRIVGTTSLSPARIGALDDLQDVQSTVAGACGRRADDTLWCWRVDHAAAVELRGQDNFFDPTQVGDGEAFRATSVVGSHTCGIRESDGALLCWGSNAHGVLGTGDAWAATPIPVPG